jgi:gamma-glutamylcyclotransferase
MTVIYYAYGSNLLFARLHARCPSIVNLGIGRLENHRLTFNKPGGDQSGKCGIEAVASDEFVLGVLYRMDRSEKPVLDKIEGLGHGYTHREVEVKTGDGALECYTYYPTILDQSLPPWDWYKGLVLEGARENNFPSAYLKMIEAVHCRVDPVTERSVLNWLILPPGL